MKLLIFHDTLKLYNTDTHLGWNSKVLVRIQELLVRINALGVPIHELRVQIQVLRVQIHESLNQQKLK